jgi:hypothetical protein
MNSTQLIDDERLRQYFIDLESHIEKAELHLGLAPGTLGNLLVDNDYVTILKIHSTIEPLLNELLEKNVTRALSHPKVSFPGGEALADFILKRNIDEKRTLALKFELVSEPRGTFIRSVTAVRNHYAHNIKNLSLSIAEIAAKANPSDEGRSIIDGLCGFKLKNAFFPRDPMRIKGMLYYNFARFLSEALEGINPPPSRPALSGYLGVLNESDDEDVAS